MSVSEFLPSPTRDAKAKVARTSRARWWLIGLGTVAGKKFAAWRPFSGKAHGTPAQSSGGPHPAPAE